MRVVDMYTQQNATMQVCIEMNVLSRVRVTVDGV
jgi:hypothetical protein